MLAHLKIEMISRSAMGSHIRRAYVVTLVWTSPPFKLFLVQVVPSFGRESSWIVFKAFGCDWGCGLVELFRWKINILGAPSFDKYSKSTICNFSRPHLSPLPAAANHSQFQKSKCFGNSSPVWTRSLLCPWKPFRIHSISLQTFIF